MSRQLKYFYGGPIYVIYDFTTIPVNTIDILYARLYNITKYNQNNALPFTSRMLVNELIHNKDLYENDKTIKLSL